MNERKLTAEQVRAIRRYWKTRQEALKVPVPRVVAKQFGVCPGTVYAVGQGHRYKEVR